MKRHIERIAYALACLFSGYTVHALARDWTVNKMHPASSWNDALAWARCYPTAEYSVFILRNYRPFFSFIR